MAIFNSYVKLPEGTKNRLSVVQVLNFDPDPYHVSPSPGMKLTPRSPGWDRASIWALASRPSGLSDRWEWDGIGMWCKNNCRQSSILTNIDIDIDVYIDLHMYMDYTLRLAASLMSRSVIDFALFLSIISKHDQAQSGPPILRGVDVCIIRNQIWDWLGYVQNIPK